MRPIILIGGGGHCMSVIDAAISAGILIKGILDLPSQVGNFVCGIPILGTDHDISTYVNDCDFIVTLGFITNPKLRIELHDRIFAVGGHLGTVIASTAHVSQFSEIGEGTVILHHANVNAGAKIGLGCIINTSANIEHSVVIGDYVHLSTGVMVNGDSTVGARTFVGSCTVVNNGKSICDDCIVGAGSVVCKNIIVPGIYAGTPARLIKNV